jgi:hypothetical protein
MGISSALGSQALLPAGLGFRNVLINGEFRINQRGYTSASNLASGSYGFDRWKSTFTNTTLTFTSAPQGQIVTINSGGSVEQVIERENVSAGTYVLSWTGTATGRVYNTGATPPSYAASPIVVTLDGLANVEVEFTASGGTRTLWKPQLEQNFQPTPFEQRLFGVELALCQRYYYRITGNTNARFAIAGNGSLQNSFPTTFLKQTMRTQPTIDYSSLSHFTLESLNGTGTATPTVIGYNAGQTEAVTVICSSSGNNTASAVQLNGATTGAWLAFSAEL